MVKRPSWIWHSYFLVYTIIAGMRLIEFFGESSPIAMYYQSLMAFEDFFILIYSLHAMSDILNIFMIIPLFLYLEKIYIFSPRFWQIMFFVRLGLELTSRSYDIQFLKSLYFSHSYIYLFKIPIAIPAVWASVFCLASLLLPSYIALYDYGFRNLKKFDLNQPTKP